MGTLSGAEAKVPAFLSQSNLSQSSPSTGGGPATLVQQSPNVGAGQAKICTTHASDATAAAKAGTKPESQPDLVLPASGLPPIPRQVHWAERGQKEAHYSVSSRLDGGLHHIHSHYGAFTPSGHVSWRHTHPSSRHWHGIRGQLGWNMTDLFAKPQQWTLICHGTEGSGIFGWYLTGYIVEILSRSKSGNQQNRCFCIQFSRIFCLITACYSNIRTIHPVWSLLTSPTLNLTSHKRVYMSPDISPSSKISYIKHIVRDSAWLVCKLTRINSRW